MKRRDFINKMAIGTASGVGAVGIAAVITEILPPETESFSLIKIGHIDDFPINEFSFIPENKIYLFRGRRQIRVLSGVCTHLGCTIKNTEQGFDCPCHGSHFDKTGKACSGPASRSLDRLNVEVNKQGFITVNLNKFVIEDYLLP
jgi:cytochrome b6-f complex iron-sulfur subunit